MVVIVVLVGVGGFGIKALMSFITEIKTTMAELEGKRVENEENSDALLEGIVTKAEKTVAEYDETINTLVKQIDNRDEFIAAFAETIYSVKRKLTEIDQKEMFKSDDEVGFVYKAINQEIQRLYDFAKKEEDTHGEKEKK